MNAPAIVIDLIGGNCPVQAEGKINGVDFYFRARGSRWSINIGGADLILAPDWRYEEPYGDGPYDAGWMSEDEARGFIGLAADRFVKYMLAYPGGSAIVSHRQGH